MSAGIAPPAALPGLTLKAWALISNVAGNVAQTLVKGSGITSVTRATPGNFNVVLTTNMATTAYQVTGNADQVAGVVCSVGAVTKAVGGGVVGTIGPAGAIDPLSWYLAYYE
jgi:hypothetical protein